MPLVGTVAGFATFGVAARAVALSIQRREITSGLGAYAASAAALGSVGYFVYGVEQRQNDLLKERKEVLIANRARRLATDESA
ncbi:hypothetical protein DFQ27_004626 [Actinomortierella ambigua]|uniref:Uncharacterized protein n=1 Tax=Actinomortierella ambigua TaxID=1343610 RepID=A0A9P6Q3E0_9FUNG|nr:hypothetical protein DFQ27_004626 [Actinomortierella ambigua]